MARNLPPALADEVEKSSLRPFLALYIALPDPVRVFTGVGEINLNGQTYIGGAGIGSLEMIQESTDGSATGVKASLFEVPADLAGDISANAKQGVAMEVYCGAFDESFQGIVGVQMIWRGRLDTFEVTDSGTSLSVTINGESRMRDQRRPSVKRFTDEYQQRKYPGDKFFQYVAQMAEVPVLWAKADQAPIGSATGSTGGGWSWGGLTLPAR